MNPQALKVRMTEMEVTQASVAEKIGLSLSRFNAKVHGWRGAEFTLQEIQKMKTILKLDADMTDHIFFS